MYRKTTSLTIALLAIISLILSACGGTTAPPATDALATAAPAATTAPATSVPATSAPETAEKVTLTIWHNWGPDDAKGPAMKSIIDDFMKANPDIVVDAQVYVDADIPLKVETSVAAHQEPELVFSGAIGSSVDWVINGIAAPVNTYVKDWGLGDQFLDSAISQYTDSEGNIIAFPIEGFTWPIWYNTTVFLRLRC